MTYTNPTKIKNRFISTRKVKNAIECYAWNHKNEKVETYYQVPNHNQSFHEYGHFRYILNNDGSLWSDGNLFLLYKVKENPKLSTSRMKLFASVLTVFKKFCDDSGTDYLNPAGYDDTPTHRFRSYLIYDTDKTAKTGERYMPVITAFYEWMLEYNGFNTPFPLWNETIHTEYGRTYSSKDVCKFPGSKIQEPSTQTYIADGEHLRPLSHDEQEAIFKALDIIVNPEYKLAFYIALESKARKQTILTLRLSDFVDSLPKSSSAKDVEEWFKTLEWPSDTERKSIMVGIGYDADSKKGLYDSYPIYIHGWLWKRVVHYIASKRAFSRRKKALQQSEELKQYLFLSQKGHAIYHAKNDLYYNDLNKLGLTTLHEGGALDTWISQTLKPMLKKMGVIFEFHFHCLRATAGKNFLESKRKANGEYKNSLMWEEDLRELAKLMNHASLDTTKHYLIYMIKNERIPQEQAVLEDEIEYLAAYFDGKYIKNDYLA